MSKPAAWLAMLLMLAAVPAAAEPAFQTFGPDAYQSFVGAWSPDTAPLCAVIDDQAHWDAVLHPAPVADETRPFSPAADFWTSHSVLLVARVINAGRTRKVFHLVSVSRTASDILVAFRFMPTPPASSTMSWYLALAVAKPLPPNIRFVENGLPICGLNSVAGAWRSPPAPAG